jgi:DNA adenine methylase
MGNNMPKKSSRSFLRWAGSKQRLLPVLSTFWSDNYDRYVEPFAGSACLFFNLMPKKALLGDINQELILTYQQIQSNVYAVLKELKQLRKDKTNYYSIRSINPNTLKPEMRAARFIYLNRYCFNGLYRTNSKGEFNVPYCGDERGTIPSDETFIECSKLLKNADFSPTSFQDTLKKVKQGDFVYMDPPFSVRSRDIFNEYDKSKFGMSDIIQLRNWMMQLGKNKIPFVVSYAESEEADLLKEGFEFKTVSVRRSIAGFISKRRVVNEVIIYNTL